MRVEEGYNRGGEAAARHCLSREMCPLGGVCAEAEAHGCAPVYPTVITVDQGEMIWADQRFEQRVFIIQEGVFASIDNPERGDGTVFAIFGCGDSAGLAELYVDRAIASTYYLWALMPGRICSLPAKALRRRLEALPTPQAERILSCSFMNIANALYLQERMVAKVKTGERIGLLVERIGMLLQREGRTLDELALSHGDLAVLTGSDRVSATRALHRLEQDGLVELGYRSIRPCEGFLRREHPGVNTVDGFRTPTAE